MSVWVTGAKGFIGSHLARELAGAGQAVHGIGHGALEEAERRQLGLQSWINGEIEAANLDALAAAAGVAPASGLPETPAGLPASALGPADALRLLTGFLARVERGIVR